MNITRCPTCHSRIALEAIVQDESGRELLALFAKQPIYIGTTLVVYLGLFRPATRDLANDRALRLANEVLALSDQQEFLATALAETIEAMRSKQGQGGWKPLSNHNYLKKVLESVLERGTINHALVPVLNEIKSPAVTGNKSKTSQVIEMLKSYPSPAGVDDWFTRTICGSLAELMIMGLDNVPAADTMHLVVDRFLNGLWPKRQWQKSHQFHGAKRLHAAFMTVANDTKRWPSIKEVLGQVPSE